MKKNFKAIKTSLIMGIILVSLIAVVMPTGQAALFKLQGNLVASVGTVSKQVTPYGNQLEIPIKIGYAISGVGADMVYFANNKAKVHIEVIDSPEWASVTVQIPQLLLDISTEFKYSNTTIGIDVNENSPAIATDTIIIKITAEKIVGLGGEVSKVEYTLPIDFKPQYAPLLGINVRNGNLQEISPMDNAFFSIDLENLANGKSEVIFEVVSLPDGWVLSKPNVLNIGSKALGDDNTGTATIAVQPPRGFGYHDDQETIQLKVVVRYAFATGETVEKEYPLDLTVYSRGISTVGIEVLAVIILLIIILLVAVIFFFKKLRK